MTARRPDRVRLGTAGKAHGLDGTFAVDAPCGWFAFADRRRRAGGRRRAPRSAAARAPTSARSVALDGVDTPRGRRGAARPADRDRRRRRAAARGRRLLPLRPGRLRRVPGRRRRLGVVATVEDGVAHDVLLLDSDLRLPFVRGRRAGRRHRRRGGSRSTRSSISDDARDRRPDAVPELVLVARRGAARLERAGRPAASCASTTCATTRRSSTGWSTTRRTAAARACCCASTWRWPRSRARSARRSTRCARTRRVVVLDPGGRPPRRRLRPRARAGAADRAAVRPLRGLRPPRPRRTSRPRRCRRPVRRVGRRDRGDGRDRRRRAARWRARSATPPRPSRSRSRRRSRAASSTRTTRGRRRSAAGACRRCCCRATTAPSIAGGRPNRAPHGSGRRSWRPPLGCDAADPLPTGIDSS